MANRRITREYRAWGSMKSRCMNVAHSQYFQYGARGIQVCQRWQDSFHAFLGDMGPCPEGMSLERVNNDGGYAPDNCKWATSIEQNNNRRSSVKITHNGVTQTIANWAREAGIKYALLFKRLSKGMPMERALLNQSLNGGRVFSPETIAKRRATLLATLARCPPKGRPCSPEHRAKISAALIANYKAAKHPPISPETRARMSTAQLSLWARRRELKVQDKSSAAQVAVPA